MNQQLIDDCKKILTELGFVSSWNRLEIYHLLGMRIVSDTGYKKRAKGNKGIVQALAQSIGTSPRLLYLVLKYVQKYPDINSLPEGKAITWFRLVKEYLVDKKGSRTKEETPNCKCPHCSKWHIYTGK